MKPLKIDLNLLNEEKIHYIDTYFPENPVYVYGQSTEMKISRGYLTFQLNVGNTVHKTWAVQKEDYLTENVVRWALKALIHQFVERKWTLAEYTLLYNNKVYKVTLSANLDEITIYGSSDKTDEGITYHKTNLNLMTEDLSELLNVPDNRVFSDNKNLAYWETPEGVKDVPLLGPMLHQGLDTVILEDGHVVIERRQDFRTYRKELS